MENNKKLRQESAFPNDVNWANGVPEQGMSKRFYAACKYSDAACKWADEMSIDTCMDVLGLPKDTKWNYLIHFPMVIIRLQYALADELLKQENQ